jgi:hypothetical protein
MYSHTASLVAAMSTQISLNRSNPWCAGAFMELCNMSSYTDLQVKLAVSATEEAGHAVLAMR